MAMGHKRTSIVVTGANGQVGRCLQKASNAFPGFEFHFLGREHFPVDNHQLTRDILNAMAPFVVINTAAYTAVDKAETETEMANSINGYAVGNLARHCATLGARFLHISTDYVFNGMANRPYTEADATDPINAYGASKLLGEQLAQKEYKDTAIVRTSWVYSQYGHNFLKTMLKLMGERDIVKVVNDQYGAPTYAADLAAVLLNMVCGEQWHAGIFHYSNKGVISWFQFAQAIRDEGKFDNCTIEPIPTSQFPTLAKRPMYSVLDCTKIEKTFGSERRDWRSALHRCMAAH